MVSGDRLKKYGEFLMLDKIAKDYGYTHAEVFKLSWREAYTIHALNLERSYIEARTSELKSEHDKNT